MYLYAATIFLSAFLLFQVQPMMGKYILPWFGGGSAVWTTCLLFFQVLLLGGYAYAHLLVSRLRPKGQGWLHLALLVASLAALPIMPGEQWKPVGPEDPVWRILGLLAATVGAPYLLLSSTGPLLQGWFSRAHPGRSPYRLYALSNAGSLLALLSYPVVFERFLRLKVQINAWSGSYALFVVLCAAVVRLLLRPAPQLAQESEPAESPPAPPKAAEVLLWLALAACASVLLMATTNQLCQDVAVVPFLWVLPLSLYLLSFILCFDRETLYSRVPYVTVLALVVLLECIVLLQGVTAALWKQVLVYCASLFLCCMVCHGELVQLKPAPRYLTLFYLMVAAGGALGGVFVVLVAPLIFTGFWELHTGLIVCGLLVLTVSGRDFLAERREGRLGPASRRSVVFSALTGVLGCVAVAGLGTMLLEHVGEGRRFCLAEERNFYGVLRVRGDERTGLHLLHHGYTLHGYQYSDERGQRPNSYYGLTSGIGYALTAHPRRAEEHLPLRIGVVGLGAGSLAVYTQPDDDIRFYEINPVVEQLANQYFTYLSDAERRGAHTAVLLGDARVVMERQLAHGEPQHFDVLAVDAFSSDAIPVHLLTRECFRVYWQHLEPDGILAVHITNRYLSLGPVVRTLAEVEGKQALYVTRDGDSATDTLPNRWVLVTSNQRFLATQAVQEGCSPWPADSQQPLLWTDEFSSLYHVLRRWVP